MKKESPPRARVVSGQLRSSRWEMATRTPAPLLQPWLRDLIGYSEQTTEPLRRPEFSTPSVVVGIEFGPPLTLIDMTTGAAVRHHGGFVAGLSEGITMTEHGGFQQGVQLNLTPVGARLLFGVSMSEMTGKIHSLRDLLPVQYRSLPERLSELSSWDERFDLVEEVIHVRVAASRVRTETVSSALQRIEHFGGVLNLGGLAHELGYTPKHVISLFHEQVGVSPGLYARMIRFSRFLKHVRSSTAPNWAELALQLGYFDQSHLVRDVKSLTGLPPTRLRQMLVGFPTEPGPASEE
jgi:AraC-like DNA-binding protein